MKKEKLLGLLIIGFILVLGACGSSSDAPGGGMTSGLQFNAAGDFDSSASAVSDLIRRVTTGQCEDLDDDAMDDPILEDGLDCDGDDGIVAHVTPSRYALAFKRATLVPADVEGEDAPQIDFVVDETGLLSDSETISFSDGDSPETVITIDPADLSAGIYSAIETEIYYFQLTFDVGGTTRNVRFYMSDDDTDEQGNLGHHQGDVTFIGDDGTEEGWINSDWSDTSENREDSGQEGASGADPETEHLRGFFGNADMWDENDGAADNIFILTLDFAEPLEIPDPSTISDLTTITATFSVADTFFYEDFVPLDTGFAPGPGTEAGLENAAWAPLAPTADLSVE